MDVNHAVRMGQRGVNGTMECEAGRIDRPITVANDVALAIYIYQVRRCHLGVVQAKGVDQEVAFFIWHTQ